MARFNGVARDVWHFQCMKLALKPIAVDARRSLGFVNLARSARAVAMEHKCVILA